MRQRVAAYLLLCAVPVCGTSACAQAPTPAFTLREVGPGVWAAIDNPDAQNRTGSNAGFIIGDDGVAVIDTFSSDMHARALLDEIRTRTRLPVKLVVNTHHHIDHVGGNGVFMNAGGLVVAHRNVIGWLHPENARLIRWHWTGTAWTEGQLTPEQEALVQALRAPNLGYEGAVDLHLADRTIQVRSFAGHTGGDSVVVIPEARVVFAGDLMWRNMAPNLIDASTGAWVETISAMLTAFPGFTFIPGHGDVATTEDVAAFGTYLMTLRRLVGNAMAEGKAGSTLMDAVTPALIAEYSRWDSIKSDAGQNVVDTEAELNGKKRIPSP